MHTQTPVLMGIQLPYKGDEESFNRKYQNNPEEMSTIQRMTLTKVLIFQLQEEKPLC